MRFSPTRLALKYANRNAHFLFAVVPCFLTALMMFPVILGFILPTLLPLALGGESSEAVVKAKSIERPGKGGPVHRLEYEFEVGGKVFSGSTQMSREQWNAARVGGPLEIHYLPSNPKVNQGSLQGELLVFAAIWLGACVGGAWSVARGVQDIRRKIRLITTGAPALAVIDCLEVRRGRKGGSWIDRLGYTYRTGEGGEGTTFHTDSRKNILYLPKEIREGDIVLVVYDRDDPSRNEIDRFDVRREDRYRLMADGER
jgi:hypothetical protein